MRSLLRWATSQVSSKLSIPSQLFHSRELGYVLVHSPGPWDSHHSGLRTDPQACGLRELSGHQCRARLWAGWFGDLERGLWRQGCGVKPGSVTTHGVTLGKSLRPPCVSFSSS